jgi:hypothetical protein
MKIINNQTVLANMADFDAMMRGTVELDNKYSKKYVESAKTYTADPWYEDPDKGTSNQRLMGDFKYAQALMDKVKISASNRNIIALQPAVEFGMYDGTEVDFEQYMRHDPRCLGRIQMPEVENGERTVRICLGVGGNCGIESGELVSRAARVMKVVKEYEDAGYGVEVFSLFAGTKEPDGGEFANALIDCSGSASGQITSAMCSTKVFRSLVFALKAMIPGISQSSLSYPVSHTQNSRDIPRLNRHLKDILGEHTIIIHAGATEEQIQDALK